MQLRRETMLIGGLAALVALVSSACATTTETNDAPTSTNEEDAAEMDEHQPNEDESAAGETAWTAKRIAGDMEIQAEWREEAWRYDRMAVTTSLPEGYPAPTPPGAIELKRYPTVRRAQVSGGSNADAGSMIGFNPLFQHIKRNDIAMTSPVEMDFRVDMDAGDAEGLAIDPNAMRNAAWTMAFLYRTADLGPTGKDGVVEIVDSEPVTVLSIGLRGPYGINTVAPGLETLTAWLERQDEWEVAGPPRAFYYNGPYIPNRDKWAEAQIPVRRAGDESATGEPTATKAEAGPSPDADDGAGKTSKEG